MKNSLFKRVAAAAAAVPLALTQCLTFSSAAAVNDAAQVADNNTQATNPKEISLNSLLRINPGENNKSEWNDKLSLAIASAVGQTGEFDGSSYADKLAKKNGELSKSVATFLKKNVFNTPVKYVVNEDKNIVLTLTLTQPDWNDNLAYTPEEALVKLAEQYGLPQLETVDFSSVKCEGTVEITVKTSELELGTTTPVSIVFKPKGEKEFTLGELPKYAQGKVDELRKLGEAAIEKNFTGIYAEKKDEANAKFNEKIELIQGKLNRMNNALDKAVNSADRNGTYSSVSEAIEAANRFLGKKNINKQLPTSAEKISAREAAKDAFNQIINLLSKNAKINASSEEVGKFIDSIGSRKLTEADGTVRATDFKIVVNKGTTELIGAFDDAEAAEVKTYVEKAGYEYIGSYKKITAKADFKGINTFDVGNVDVQIERILVTNTTAPTVTTTSGEGETTTTTAKDVTTTTAKDVTTTTGEDVTTTTANDVTTTTSEDVTTTTSEDVTTTTSEDVTTTTTSEDVTTTTSEDVTTTTGKDVTTTTSEDVTTTTSEDVTTTTSEDVTTTTGKDVTTTTSEDVTTTTSEDVTTTTGKDVTTTTTGDVTTTTCTIPPDVVTSSIFESVYVDVETTHGFYLNTDASFDTKQIKKATLHVVYGIGYESEGKAIILSEFEETMDVTGKLGFGTATPANTYKAVENQFTYDIQLTYTGEKINDKEGNQILATNALMRDKEGKIATVEAYIGVKGDVNLDNIVDARDATATLTYYAKSSTAAEGTPETKLSPNNKAVPTAEHVMDDFASFLTDVKFDTAEKRDTTAEKTDRVIDGRDATSILTFYALTSVEENKGKTPVELWTKLLGTQE